MIEITESMWFLMACEGYPAWFHVNPRKSGDVNFCMREQLFAQMMGWA